MKLDIDDLRFVLALDRVGSLAALAREENVTPPAVTKRLGQLEARLGVRLAMRTTRRLQLTHEGHLLAQHATGVIERMQAIEEALQQRSQVVAGKLKVHGPFGFGRRHLAPLLDAFRASHPQVEVQLFLSDNLMLPSQPVHGRDAFDVLVSIGEMPDSRWVAHRLAPNRRILCAAPAYLRGAPPIDSPADLARHACLVLRENDEDVTLWRLRHHDGTQATVRIDPVLACNDGGAARHWALAGMGILVRSEWDVAGLLRQGRLVELLPDWRLPDADIVALVASRQARSARTEHFLRHLHELGDHAPWLQATP